MSYFPSDIPFMSDGELKENDIYIPKDVSDTNAGNIRVVFCRECKYFLKPHACLSEDGMVTAQEDGFCSYGERKNDVPTNIIESLKEEINTVNRLNDRIKNRGNNG